MRTISTFNNRTHGMSHSPEYRAWIDIKRRCLNPRCPTWKHYGGRGIKVKFASFEAFFAEVGFCPSRKHSIHRLDNDGHYETGNVAWVTGTVQHRNKRIWKNVMRARKNAARIRKLYEAGSRCQDIATRFRISITTVRTLLKEQKYKPKSRVKPKTCSSRFRGVSWHKKCGKWRAVAHVDGKPRHLGVFKREMDASVAYQAAKQSFYLN
jgi:hypothetical protein